MWKAWIQRDVAASLFKQAGLDFEQLKKQAQSNTFRAVPLKGVTLSADYRVKHETVVSKNVVGPAARHDASRSDGHLHALTGITSASASRMRRATASSTAPWTTRSGIAAVLELARLFGAAPKTARSVVFLAVTAEEKGLLGSEYYASNPLYPLETTVADINMDSLGTCTDARGISARIGPNTLVDEIDAAAASRAARSSPDPRPEAGQLLSLRPLPAVEGGRAGGVILAWRGSREWRQGERASRCARNTTAKKYHQPKDEWSESLDFTGEAQDVALLYNVGRSLATRRAGRSGKPAASSRRCATSRAASGSEFRLGTDCA